ncbi:Trypsin-1 [Harpegnathos saltator]|nr:Trypsin-1 [Harpegnathos saltator]
MTPKGIVVFALLAVTVAVAFAEKPYLGFRLPLDMTQVVGGKEAEKHAYPHLVSLQYGLISVKHFCAGTILNQRWIITAAHCVQAVPSLGKFVVKAGKHSIGSTESTEQTVNVAASFVHENYPGGVAPYDIALLKLEKDLKFTNEVKTIKIAAKDSKPTGNAILSGWGSMSRTIWPDMPDKLQDVQLPMIDVQTCSDAIRKLTGSSPVHETNVCTGPLDGSISACSGDSGGPLIQKTQNDSTLIGIVSWGVMPCGSKGAPSVYTGVSKYNDWISKTISSN